MDRPACFPSQHAFVQWQRDSIKARDKASPCTDCDRAYKTRMQRQGLCQERAVRKEFRITSKMRVIDVMPVVVPC